MKFEKHLKNTGIYGVIFVAKNGDKYLRCGKNGNVLARIPAGFAPIGDLVTHKLETWIDEILIGGADELLESKLIAAELEKDGKARDIRRVWGYMSLDGTITGHRCKIDNTAFGLIERGDDVRIFDPRIDGEEIEPLEDLEPIDELVEEAEEAEAVTPALVILDRDQRVAGIIFEPAWWEN